MAKIEKAWGVVGHTRAALGLLVILIQAGVYLNIKLSPIDDWFTYHAMEVDKLQIQGQGLNVRSYASFKKPADLQYTDVLQCLDETIGIWINFSYQVFAIENHYPPDKDTPLEAPKYGEGENVYLSPWRYAGITPNYEALCRIRGVQSLSLWFGLKKESVIYTNRFLFISRELYSNER